MDNEKSPFINDEEEDSLWKEFKKTGEPVRYCEFCRKREKLVKEDEFGMGK